MTGASAATLPAGPAAKVTGAPIVRSEDARFLTGRGCFVDDFTLPGLAHAVVVRSAVAHGVLRGVDTAAARALPGVLGVLTAGDVAAFAQPIPVRVGPLQGLSKYLQRPLATDTVRYVGEPIAVVVAVDRYLAEDAADRVVAEIDALEPVVGIAQALAGTTLVHAATGTNVASRHLARRGDADAAFAGADYTRRELFRCHRHSAVPLETRGLVAQWDAEASKLRVWGATKVPFFNRGLLAKMMGLPDRDVDLIELDVGGSFGARGEFYPEDLLIPVAAKLLGCPVKWIEDRRENLLAMNHSREMECELEIAARRDGTILALRGRLFADIGAYARTTGGIVPAKAAAFLPGPYRIDDYACEVHAVVTHKTPAGTYRGPGRYEANFFRERLIDLMADDLGLDAAAVRLHNLVPPERMPYPMGALVPYEGASEYDSGDYPAALRRALEIVDYAGLAKLRGRQVDGRLHGVGLACFVDSSGAGPAENARVRVRAPGRIELYTGCASSGQGHETSFAQILADALGVGFESIRVFHGSTTLIDHGYGTYHGRGMAMGGSAVRLAGQALVDGLLAEAARRTGLPREALRYQAGAVLRSGDRHDAAVDSGDPHHRGVQSSNASDEVVLSLASLCREADAGDERARGALVADARFEQTRLTFEYGAQVAHVAIDPQTAQLEVVRFVTVEDCGNVINPLIVHGQVIGASVQGLSGTLLEEFRYDEAGQMTSGSFADYLMATSTDFPNVEAHSLNMAPSRLNPLGAKGVGEGGIEGTGGALANAAADALRPLGVHITELPLSPDRLARLIREARSRRGADQS